MPVTYSLKRKRSLTTASPSSPPPKTPLPSNALSSTRDPLVDNANARLAQSSPGPSKFQRVSSSQTNKTITSHGSEKKTKKLTQLVLDLGGPAEKQCRICGMQYVPSQADDNALHVKHHDNYVNGAVITSSQRAGGKVVGVCPAVKPRRNVPGRGMNMLEDVVLKIDRRGNKGARRLVETVLERVEGELGAVRLGRDELWSEVREGVEDKVKAGETAKKRIAQLPTPPASSSPAPEEKNGGEKQAPRFTAYLYVHGNRIYGLCLAERIRAAHWTLPGTSTSSTSDSSPQARTTKNEETNPTDPIQLDQPEAAQTGVARIWVLPSGRRKGVAGRLLDAVASWDGERGDNAKEMMQECGRVAFSQLTAMGEGLARRWTEKRGEHSQKKVLVYDERGCYG